MVSEQLIYSRRLASGLRTQKRERETITLTLEKRSAKRGGLTFSSAPTHEDEVLGVAGTPIQSRARSFDWEEMLCTVCNIAGAPSCHVRTHICQTQARSATYFRSATPDNAGPVTCAVTRYDREDVVDREGVADRADVSDREIGKILPIEKILSIGKITKVSPIGQIFPIGRSGRYCRSETYC
jgi:hypothetical protein